MRKLLLSIILLLVCAAAARAQVYPFRTYSIEDGLSESVVNAVAQDHEGYLWLGTGYGLNRFNGIEFQSYFEDHGLRNSKIHALYEDSQHRLWVGTARGVNYWKDDSLYTDAAYSVLDGMVITDIYEDSHGDLWFATDNSGVWVFNREGEGEHYSMSHGLRSRNIRSILETDGNMMWFATERGLSGLRFGNITNYDTRHGLPSANIQVLAKDYSGRLWAGTDRGVVKFEDGSFTVYGQEQGLNNLNVHTLTFDDTGRLWAGTENGVSLLENGRFKNFTTANGLSNSIIYSAVNDREGNLWFGTFGGGVNLFLGDYFENFTTETGLSNNVVTSFTESDNGILWIGTYGGGINIYGDSTFSAIGTGQGLKDDKVYTLTYDSQKRIWAGLHNGLAVISEGSIRNIPQHEFPWQKVRNVYEAQNGMFWISTYGEGLIRYDGSRYRQFTTGDGLADNTVLGTTEDTAGNIWIATYGGVSRYNGTKFENFTIQDGLPNNAVMTIMRDHQNRIWVSTFGGIAWYSSGRFNSITVDDGLPNRVCYFIEQTEDGAFWIGTNDGLTKFDAVKFNSEIPAERAEAFQVLSREQGLISDEMNLGAVYSDADGHLWVGSVEGMSHFFPAKYQGSRLAPPVKIEEVVVSGLVFKNRSDLKLNYDQNFVEIHFSGINYAAPNRVLYEFKMEGIDPVWQQTTDRFAKYPSMPAGEYTFNVLARNTNGAWSNEVTRLNFRIYAPFWQQWWFRILLVLIVLGIIWLIYNNYKTGKQVDIERMRVRIASDLHDDVGASLTEIALQSDFLQALDTSPELKKSLSSIGAQSRRIVNSLDDIVWSIDSRNDTLGDLTDRMQDYILNVLAPKNFNVEYDFEALKMQHKLSVVLKENLYLIFKEAVNNITKYSNGDLVRITMQTDGNNFTFTIHDNGTTGPGSKKSGHGLRNMKMRAARIRAGVDINRENGFTVTIRGKLNIN